jgi:hypothetical protein
LEEKHIVYKTWTGQPNSTSAKTLVNCCCHAAFTQFGCQIPFPNPPSLCDYTDIAFFKASFLTFSFSSLHTIQTLIAILNSLWNTCFSRNPKNQSPTSPWVARPWEGFLLNPG